MSESTISLLKQELEKLAKRRDGVTKEMEGIEAAIKSMQTASLSMSLPGADKGDFIEVRGKLYPRKYAYKNAREIVWMLSKQFSEISPSGSFCSSDIINLAAQEKVGIPSTSVYNSLDFLSKTGFLEKIGRANTPSGKKLLFRINESNGSAQL